MNCHEHNRFEQTKNIFEKSDFYSCLSPATRILRTQPLERGSLNQTSHFKPETSTAFIVDQLVFNCQVFTLKWVQGEGMVVDSWGV